MLELELDDDETSKRCKAMAFSMALISVLSKSKLMVYGPETGPETIYYYDVKSSFLCLTNMMMGRKHLTFVFGCIQVVFLFFIDTSQ